MIAPSRTGPDLLVRVAVERQRRLRAIRIQATWSRSPAIDWTEMPGCGSITGKSPRRAH
jgi:hypothetical protein